MTADGLINLSEDLGIAALIVLTLAGWARSVYWRGRAEYAERVLGAWVTWTADARL